MGGKFTKKRNKNGEGGIACGYRYVTIDGERIFEHIAVAEKALGKKLPKGTIVHHADENRLNNSPDNLVVCPDAAYHRLLHIRMRALKESGNPNYRCCGFCKKWVPFEELKYNKASYAYYHGACRQADRKAKGKS